MSLTALFQCVFTCASVYLSTGISVSLSVYQLSLCVSLSPLPSGLQGELSPSGARPARLLRAVYRGVKEEEMCFQVGPSSLTL